MTTDLTPVADGRPRTADIAVVALTVVVLAETLRTLYPLGYALVGDLGFIVTPLLLLLVFLAPLLSLLLEFAGPRVGLWVAVAFAATARLALQVLSPPSLVLAVVATALVLVAASTVVAAVLRGPTGPLAVAAGVLAGFGADAALKGADALWDRVWQATPSALATTVVLVGLLIAAAWRAERGGLRCGAAEHGQGRRMYAVTVLLMPAMLMFQSPSFVGSSAGVGMIPATMSTVLASMAALAVLAFVARRSPGRALGLAAGGALAATAFAMAVSTGPSVIAWTFLGQALIGVLLLCVLAPTVEPSSAQPAWGSTGGFVSMFALTLLYPMHYEMPLPVPNTVLPSIAVLLACIALVGPRVTSAPPPTPTWAVRPAVGVACLGGAAVLWLAASASDPRPLTSAQGTLAVATFNVDQAADDDGALDFEQVARSIDLLDADLVALQEVGRGWPLSGMNDLAAWLRQTHGMTLHFAPAADQQFGNALVTRVVLDDVSTLPLPKGAGSMDRSAVVATVETPGGRVTVIAVHLQHRNSTAGIAAREAELRTVLERWDSAPRTIVLGDLNADNRRPEGGGDKVLVGPEQANTLQPLLDAGFGTTQSTTVCIEPTSNDNCSDFVLVTADLLQQPPVEVLDDQGVGDHRPVRSIVLITRPD